VCSDWSGRRLLSAPLINNSQESGLAEAAAAVVSGVEAAGLSDFPSPASSAAEALELESGVTFGQDATDFLDENSSTAGHG